MCIRDSAWTLSQNRQKIPHVIDYIIYKLVWYKLLYLKYVTPIWIPWKTFKYQANDVYTKRFHSQDGYSVTQVLLLVLT